MLPPRRRTWPIVLGVAMLLVAIPSCLFTLTWSWNVGVPAGHDTHRISIEHGRLVVQHDTVSTPPPSTGLRWDAGVDPGISIEYAHTFRAPSFWSRRFPFAIFVIAGAVASIGFAYYRKKQPPGHCAECGYDLRGSSGACPECGHRIVGGGSTP